jgi:hypothetical protein
VSRPWTGATGLYPDGKISPSDEGEIQIAVGVDPHGVVVIDFGKPVAWLAMTPDGAMQLGLVLIERASRCSIHRKPLTVEGD